MPIAPKEKMTVEQLAAVFSYDAATGIVRWRIQPQSRVQAGDVAGCLKPNGYIRILYRGDWFLAHRVAWALHYGEWPVMFVDHKNRDRSDNRIANLRECSHAENMRNRPGIGSSKTGLKGVCQEEGRFRASIGVDGKKVRLGSFRSPEDASLAYQQAAKRLHKEFASF